MKNYLLITFLSLLIFSAVAQNRSSSQNGDWHQSATWGGASVPDNSTGTFGWISINHQVTVRASAYTVSAPLQLDNVLIGTNGSLIIEAGAAVRLQNGSGADIAISGAGTFLINGILIANSGVTYSGLTASNTTFFSTAQLRTSSLNLPSASGYNDITVSLEGLTAGANLNSTWNQLSSGTDLIVNCPDLGANAINFNGILTNLESLQIQDTDGDAGGYVTLNLSGASTVNIGSGGVAVSGDSRFLLTYNGNVSLNLNGNLNFNSSSTAHSGNTISGTGVANFINGNFVMTQGDWRMVGVSTAGTGQFIFDNSSGITVTGGVISEQGSNTAQGTWQFVGSSNQNFNVIPSAYGIGTLNLIVNKAGGSVLLANAAIVTDLTLTSGTLSSNSSAASITVNGVLSATSGVIDSSTTPISFSIAGTGSIPASLPFTAGSIFQNLTLNRTGAMVNIPNAFMANEGAISIFAGTLTSPISAIGVYDLNYNNTAPYTMGSEIQPASLRNLTIGGTSSVAMVSNLTLAGSLVLNSGSLTTSNFNISIGGNLTTNQNLTMASASTLTFASGTHQISGSGTTLTIGALDVTGALSISRNLNVAGSILVRPASSIAATAGTMNITSSTTITNNGTSVSFNNVNITGSLTAPLNGTLGINGSLSGSGAFVNNGSTVVFGGNGSFALSGATRTFNHISVSTGRTVTTTNSITVSGNITNDGVINFTAGTLTKSQNGVLSGSGSTTLNAVSIAAGRTFTANSPLTLKSNLGGSGIFTSTSEVNFTGTTTMSGAGAKSFQTIQVAGTFTPNSSYSVGQHFTVTSGTLNPGSATVTFNGTTTVSGGGSISFNNVIISGALTFPSSTVTLAGNMTNNGSFSSGNGTIAFSSSGSMKSFLGSNAITVNNLTIANNAGAVDVRNSNAQGVNVTGLVSVAPGAVLDADGTANNVFTLMSTSTTDASIGPLLSGASVSGIVSVQRFIPAMDNVYRYISSPVVNSPISDLQNSGIAVTGEFDGTSFGQPECGGGCDNNYINLGWYDETARFGPYFAIGSGYQIMPSAGNNNTEALVPGRGYEIYMWNGLTNLTWTARGSVNQQDVSFSISHTPSTPAAPTEDGWNLIGNPYPSAIRWEDNTDLPGGWSFTDVDPAVYVWDEALGAYRYYDHSTNSGDLTNGVIAKGQAFWVYANNTGNAALTIHEQAKSSVNGTFYRTKESVAQKIPGLKIILAGESNGKVVQDITFLLSGQNREVSKLETGRETISIASIKEGKRMLYTSFDDKGEIPLSFKVAKAGSYVLSMESLEGFDLNDYEIVDLYENARRPAAETYEFNVSSPELTHTQSRFLLVKRGVKVVNGELVKYYPNPTNKDLVVSGISSALKTVSILNSMGVGIGDVTFEKTNEKELLVHLDLLPGGIYFIRIKTVDGQEFVHKFVKR